MNYFNYYWLVGGSVGYVGCGIIGIIDDVVYFVGGLVFCLFFFVFLCLVVVLFMVWQLFMFLVEILCDAVWCQTVGDFVYFVYVCYFFVVCLDVMGVYYVVGNFCLFVFLYVVNFGD